jgi:hypothetical protein
VKEVDTLAEDLRFMIFFDSQSLPRVQPTESLLQFQQDFVVHNAPLEAVSKLRERGGWPGPDVIPNGCRSQFGEPHVDQGHPAAA